MKWYYVAFFWMLAGTTVNAQLLDERCVQQGPSACIDWDRGIVVAEGVGAPSSKAANAAVRNASAIRAAKLDAYRNLLEMIKGVNLSSSTTMRDAMVSDDTILTQVQGFLHGLRPVEQPRYFGDGTVKVRVEARLRDAIPQELALRDALKVPTPDSPKELSSVPSSNSSTDVNQIYTGLIIDARGTKVMPAMSPKVFDESGKQVYGSGYIDRSFVVKQGMAGYVKDLEKAKKNDRVQGNPLVVKALQSQGTNRVDLVLSQEDSEKIRKIAAHQNLLKEARVVIVVD